MKRLRNRTAAMTMVAGLAVMGAACGDGGGGTEDPAVEDPATGGDTGTTEDPATGEDTGTEGEMTEDTEGDA